MLLLFTTAAGPQSGLAASQATQYTLPPKVLVLRGVFEVFSLGMNDLARKLACRGYDVKVTSWAMALHETQCAGPQPYVIIGHSLGGRMCGWTSRKLMNCGERVPLLIIVDANLIQRIPANVEKCLHLYVTNPYGLFHGHPVRGESPCTEVINWDVSNGQLSWFDGGVNHFNIDATPWVHQIIMDELASTFPLPTAMSAECPPLCESEVLLPASAESDLHGVEPTPSSRDCRKIPWSPSRTEVATTKSADAHPQLAWRPRHDGSAGRSRNASEPETEPPASDTRPASGRPRKIPWSPTRPDTRRADGNPPPPALAWRAERPDADPQGSAVELK
jgi:hypothetical protein